MIDLAGASQYITSSGGSFPTAPPLTMSCWTIPRSISSNERACVCLGNSASSNKDYFKLYFKDINVTFGAAGTAEKSATIIDSIAINTLYHIAGIEYAVDSRAVFLDGATKVTNAASTTPTGIDTCRVGATADDTPHELHGGCISEVGLWNVALTDEEILILSKGFCPLFVRPSNLVLYIPGVRDIRTVVNDAGATFSTPNSFSVYDHPRVIMPSKSMMSPSIVEQTIGWMFQGSNSGGTTIIY